MKTRRQRRRPGWRQRLRNRCAYRAALVRLIKVGTRRVASERLGAREDETMGAFTERLATMAGVVPADVHERGWQWRPTAADTAFAPPFGTIRQCRVCGCLVAGGPTACARCAEEGAG